MRVGVIGNTLLTSKCVDLIISEGHTIDYVFGLSKDKLTGKANSCLELKSKCERRNISFIDSGDWEDIVDRNVEVVIEMGDSRIVPESFLNKNKVIGNHGALLPYIKGGASLTWGRMLGTGEWGVSIFELTDELDNGDIIKTKKVKYTPENTTMEEFVEICDQATVDCLKDFLQGNYSPTGNRQWRVKVRKHVDSHKGASILDRCVENNIVVYMPTRNTIDSELKEKWPQDFKNNFKKANNSPYPKWYEKGEKS